MRNAAGMWDGLRRGSTGKGGGAEAAHAPERRLNVWMPGDGRPSAHRHPGIRARRGSDRKGRSGFVEVPWWRNKYHHSPARGNLEMQREIESGHRGAETLMPGRW